jgi:hypothetical protein
MTTVPVNFIEYHKTLGRLPVSILFEEAPEDLSNFEDGIFVLMLRHIGGIPFI